MHSHSATTQFNNCPYAHHLKDEGYKGPEKDVRGNQAEWSRGLHAALEAMELGKTQAEVWEAFTTVYPEDLDPTDNLRTQEAATHTLAAYRTNYHRDAEEWETIATEFDNKADISDTQSHLVIDSVRRHRASGSIYLWDYKVKKEYKYGWGKQYELDAQFSRYVEYARSKWGDCAGVYIDLIVPNYRSKKWKDRPAGWDIKLERKSFTRTTDHVAWWKQSQADWERLMLFCDEQKVWPKHQGPLCSYCTFYDHCMAATQGAGQEILDSLYTEFNPLEEGHDA